MKRDCSKNPCRLCRKRARGQCDCGACEDCLARYGKKMGRALKRQPGKRLSSVQMRARVERVGWMLQQLAAEFSKMDAVPRGFAEASANSRHGCLVQTLFNRAGLAINDVAWSFGSES